MKRIKTMNEFFWHSLTDEQNDLLDKIHTEILVDFDPSKLTQIKLGYKYDSKFGKIKILLDIPQGISGMFKNDSKIPRRLFIDDKDITNEVSQSVIFRLQKLLQKEYIRTSKKVNISYKTYPERDRL